MGPQHAVPQDERAGDGGRQLIAFERILYGNSLSDWIVAGVVAVAVWSGLSILRRLVASRYRQFSTAQHPTPIRLIFYLIGDTKQFEFAYPTQRVVVER